MWISQNILQNKILLFVCGLFIVARIGFINYSVGFNSISLPGSDGPEYNSIAESLYESGTYAHNGRPTASKAPTYPLFLYLVYLFFGENNFIAVKIIQIALLLITALLFYRIAIIIFNSKEIGITYLFLSSIYPIFVYFSGRFASENLIMFFVALIFWLLFKYENSRCMFLYILLGISNALLVFLKPTLILLSLIIAIRLIRKGKSFIPYLTLFILSISIVILPWTIRNYTVFEKNVSLFSLTTHGGKTFWGANNEIVYSNKIKGKWIDFQDKDIDWDNEVLDTSIKGRWGGLEEYKVDKELYRMAFQWIQNNPLKFIKLIPYKIIRFLDFDQHSYQADSKLKKMIGFFTVLPLLLLYFIGNFFIIKNKNLNIDSKKIIFINLYLLSLLVGVIIFYGDIRQRIPFENFILIYASYALDRIAVYCKSTMEKYRNSSLL